MSQSTAFHTKNTVVYQHVAPVVNELFEVYIPEIEDKIWYYRLGTYLKWLKKGHIPGSKNTELSWEVNEKIIVDSFSVHKLLSC